MTTKIINLIHEINFRTSVLESLGWDESQLQALFLYLNNALTNDYAYNDIINHVNKEFSEETCLLIQEVFKEEAFLYHFRSLK